jgi:hypothetical protein
MTRVQLHELSRIALGRIREKIFRETTEADLGVLPGSLREMPVSKRAYGSRQPLGKLVWEMRAGNAAYEVTVTHDGDVRFSIIVMRKEKNVVCALESATIANLPSRVKLAVGNVREASRREVGLTEFHDVPTSF